MIQSPYIIRPAKPEEFEEVGKVLVEAYQSLETFTSPEENPEYFKRLASIGKLTENPLTELLIATPDQQKIAGAVVFFGDMQYYGGGGIAYQERDAAGFRFLGIDPAERGKGISKYLIEECIQKARHLNKSQMIIHSTKAMMVAWKMYERMGFRRSADLDFTKGKVEVFGFRLDL